MEQERPADAAIIDLEGINSLIALLRARGYATRGPVVRDGAIVPGELAGARDLPIGYHDQQGPGTYRLEESADAEAFGWAVGPQSLKGDFFSPHSVLWRGRSGVEEPEIFEPVSSADLPVAFIGARPCELAALSMLDRVLSDGSHPDARYGARRRGTFIAVAECGTPSATCFCNSMGTGPGVEQNYDLAITEIAEDSSDPSLSSSQQRHHYLVRAGSEPGRSVLAELPKRSVEQAEWAARQVVLDRATEQMGGRLDTTGLPGLLARNLDHPRWAEVADRCLACGNCTMVCPTCFCSDIHDVTDLSGGIERTRRWSSCFELSHSFLHGGAVRTSTASRYRQWATHKLSTWHDQFGTSGCVGCGRCIVWCPVGIDITEEVRAIRAADGAKGPVETEGANT